MLLAGKVAIVTGSTRGIGKGIAHRFALAGAAVVVNGRDAVAVAAAAEELRALGGSVLEAPADVTVKANVERLYASTMDAFGKADILVNNALAPLDRGQRVPFLQMQGDNWEAFTRANLNALFYCTQGAARIMAQQAIHGSIINISSVGAARAHRYTIAYDAVKGAVESFTRAVAVDLGPWGIRVNALRPGPILVETQPRFFEPRPALEQQVPLGRLGYPEDIAGPALFLASDEASFVTGQIFDIDGGLLAQARPPCAESRPLVTPANIGAF